MGMVEALDAALAPNDKVEDHAYKGKDSDPFTAGKEMRAVLTLQAILVGRRQLPQVGSSKRQCDRVQLSCRTIGSDPILDGPGASGLMC
jgi:hypothetical protein